MTSANKVKNVTQRASETLEEVTGRITGQGDILDQDKDDRSAPRLKQAGETIMEAFRK